ncbi:MAG: hypothetical protein Q7S52_00410 [bacterium]|nr:hypothetical protein [bacterium]
MSEEGGTARYSYNVGCKYRFGWITCTDGTESEYFATTKKGLQILNDLVHMGLIDESAVPKFTREIEESGLLPEDEKLDELLEVIQTGMEMRMLAANKGEKKRETLHAVEKPTNTKRTLH